MMSTASTQELIVMAQHRADEDTEHKYTQVPDFQPHTWVWLAMRDAYNRGRTDAVEDLTSREAKGDDLRDAIYNFLAAYRLSNWEDEDGNSGYPLTDALSNGAGSIAPGLGEIEDIADALAAHLDPLNPAAQEAATPAEQAVGDGVLDGKYGDVLRPFIALMDCELHANAGKGDRPGWLSMDRKTALLEIFYHLAKLQKAAKDDDHEGIREYGADVANMAMMLVDVCGALSVEESTHG